MDWWKKEEIKGNISHIDDLSDIKKIDLGELRGKIDLNSNAMEKYDTVTSSLEKYDVDDPEIVKYIDKAIINKNGGEEFLKSLKANGGSYELFDRDRRFSQTLSGIAGDFLIIEQLYDDFREITYELRSLLTKTIKQNIKISNKLEDDLSYYSVADML